MAQITTAAENMFLFLSPFERMVATRYLRARRAEGFISVTAGFSLVGIALGVATLIVVLAVMNGVRSELIQSIIGLEGHVNIYSQSRNITQFDTHINTIKQQSDVVHAIPIAEGQVMLSFNGRAQGAKAVGIRAQDLQAKPLLTQKIAHGTLEAFRQGEGIMIGERMAERLGLNIGDALTLISPEGRATFAGVVPRIKTYKVVTIFKIGMFAYDNGLVVLPFKDAQLFFKLRENEATAIEVMGIDPDKSLALAKKINALMPEGFRIYDWKMTNGHIFRAVLVQRNVMLLILTLIILVASFNIISSLIMLVREKSRDIAVMRTMGATRSNIMRIFMATGFSIGMIGTLIGIILGLLIAFNTESIKQGIESLTGQPLLADELYFLSTLPAEVNWSEVIIVCLIALLLSFLATLYPARRAATLDPTEVLRYE